MDAKKSYVGGDEQDVIKPYVRGEEQDETKPHVKSDGTGKKYKKIVMFR